jgi:hypothetical protein
MVVAIDWMAPAPRPCRVRNAISGTMVEMSPQAVEPTRKMHDPTKNTRLRPNRSASRP